jgi:hypothetical protein
MQHEPSSSQEGRLRAREIIALSYPDRLLLVYATGLGRIGAVEPPFSVSSAREQHNQLPQPGKEVTQSPAENRQQHYSDKIPAFRAGAYRMAEKLRRRILTAFTGQSLVMQQKEASALSLQSM